MNPRLLLALSLVLLAGGIVALLAGPALAAEGVTAGSGGDALGYLGGASGIGGMTLVAYILVRYLPKRDADLMAALKEKDGAVHQALKEKDVMWSDLLKQNDTTWQANFDAMRHDLQALQGTNDKLRQAVLHLANKPGMTSLSVPAMNDKG